MIKKNKRKAIYAGASLVALLAPFLAPAYQSQMAVLWLMVVLALTWDILGGQMGYNSFGNIIFFGMGMYVTAVIQRNLVFSETSQFSISESITTQLPPAQYLGGMALGLVAGVVVCVLFAAVFGNLLLRMRGQYFAICTLGLGIAMGEIASGIEYIGAGSGMITPLFPDVMGNRTFFFYYYFLCLAVITLFSLKALYATKFGLVINAIRDNEAKAEAMGIQTTRYKMIAWCIAAFFLSLAGGAYGNLIGFIDPIDVAFSGSTLGVWMILMAILGGKGTIWGPVIGAAIFHVTQELFWTFLLGWQRVALGLLIVLIVVFFPQGILGWARGRWPESFGVRLEANNQLGRESSESA